MPSKCVHDGQRASRDNNASLEAGPGPWLVWQSNLKGLWCSCTDASAKAELSPKRVAGQSSASTTAIGQAGMTIQVWKLGRAQGLAIDSANVAAFVRSCLRKGRAGPNADSWPKWLRCATHRASDGHRASWDNASLAQLGRAQGETGIGLFKCCGVHAQMCMLGQGRAQKQVADMTKWLLGDMATEQDCANQLQRHENQNETVDKK